MIEVDRGRPGLRRTRRSRSGRSTTQAEADAARGGEGLDVQARRRQLPPRRPLAAAAADLRARADRVAARARLRRDLRRRRRHPGHVHRRAGARRPAARRRRGRDRQGPRERAARRRPATPTRSLIVTDVDAVYADWGTPEQRAIRRATPGGARRRGVRRGLDGAEGARRLLVRRARPAGCAAIGSIDDTQALLRGEAGTTVTRDADGSRSARRLRGDATMATTADAPTSRSTSRRAEDRGLVRAVPARGRRAALGVDPGERSVGRRGRVAARVRRAEQVRRGRGRAALARVRAPVPRPDADRAARRRASGASTR